MRSRSRPTRGSALFLVLILAVLMAAVMAGLFTYVSQNARMEKRSNLRQESTYAADYAFEQAFSALSTLVAQNGAALPTIAQTTAVTNLTTAPTALFSPALGYTWRAYLTVPLEGGVPVAAHSSFDPAQGSYKFLTLVEFDRTLPQQAPMHLQFQREWTYVLTPLFQYAIFYHGDLELFPGANFIVNGRVHSNGKIYAGTSATITFTDYVSEVNGFSNQYSLLDPRGPGSPGNAITYGKGPAIATSREEPPGALTENTSDTNTNNDGPRELIETPDFLYSDPNATDRLYNKAGLKILANTTGSSASASDGTIVPAGSRVFTTLDGTTIPATDPFGAYLSTLVSTGAMNDYREGATLTTTDVDVSKLTAAYDAGGLPQTIPASSKWPNSSAVPAALKGQTIPPALRGKSFWNGILYVADVTNDITHRTGVRLLKGTELPDGSNSASPTPGLTLATVNPAYIVGDFNTGGSPAVNSGSNLAASNYVSGYTVQPASLIADAVTVVSSNWTTGNYNTVGSLNSRTPANTTINAAIVSGNTPSNGSAYSGGVENFIRLLENWSGRRLTYYGSLINMFPSQQATAPWQNTGVYYNAPVRNWYFDVNFLDPRKLPPGTPVSRSLKRGQWAQIH